MPNCWSTLSIYWLLSSVPLSDSMYLGHRWTGRYWLMKVDTMVSADLSGIGNAFWPSWEVIYYSKNVFCCLNLRFYIWWPNLWQSCWKDILEFLSSGEGKPELLLFLCDKGHIGWCISLYLCSFLSNNIVILWGNKFMSILGVLVYHVLLLILCISMPWGSQETKISGVSQWRVCKAAPLHVWRNLPDVLVLFYLTVAMNYICKRGLSFAFVVVLPVYLLTKILVWCFLYQWLLVLWHLYVVWDH